jgi:hypothetical protein
MNDPTSPNEQNAVRASTDNRERLLDFSPAEMRLLIITIIGTVAGTLIAVLAVGLAFLCLRILLPSRGPDKTLNFINLVVITISNTLLVGAFAAILRPPWRRQKIGSSNKTNLFVAILYWLIIVAEGMIILAWIGLAAGISK